jgi:hypothetical protein
MLRYMSKREKVREKIEIVRGGKERLRGRGREEKGFFFFSVIIMRGERVLNKKVFFNVYLINSTRY